MGARAEPIAVWHEITYGDLLVSYISEDNADAAQRLKNNIQAGRLVAVREQRTLKKTYQLGLQQPSSPITSHSR